MNYLNPLDITLTAYMLDALDMDYKRWWWGGGGQCKPLETREQQSSRAKLFKSRRNFKLLELTKKSASSIHSTQKHLGDKVSKTFLQKIFN